jgi:ornithine cyclodeaminase/alanine dehydrogenase-like protein (mu-crystallin family)
VAGSKNGRKSDEEITLFKSVGVAVEDIVAADLVYRNAGQRMTRLGQNYDRQTNGK